MRDKGIDVAGSSRRRQLGRPRLPRRALVGADDDLAAAGRDVDDAPSVFLAGGRQGRLRVADAGGRGRPSRGPQSLALVRLVRP